MMTRAAADWACAAPGARRRALLMACLLESIAILGAALMLLGYRWLPPEAFAGLALLFVLAACPLLAIVVARSLLERQLRALTRARSVRRLLRPSVPVAFIVCPDMDKS